MFTKIRNHKIAASILLLALVIILVLGYFFRRQSFDNPVAKVMYLVPEDETKIEDVVKPEKLASQTDIWIETTSDWEQISRLAADGKVYAVIIHHVAVYQVDLEELQYLFHHKRLVVTTIGISTDKMVEMLDEPIFHDEMTDDICNAICSVVYSTREAKGVVEVMGPDGYEDQILGESMRPSHTADLLNYDAGVRSMWNSIRNHIWEMQRDYQSSNEARPTLTIAEIEALLRDPNHQ